MLVGRAKQYAEGCGNRWAWFLPYLTTENSARDMDAIRAALGEEKISYLGYSYGTYLGAVYATLFPQRVRRLVLDSVVDPDGVWYEANIAQDHSLRPAAPRLPRLGGRARRRLQARRDRRRRCPSPGTPCAPACATGPRAGWWARANWTTSSPTAATATGSGRYLAAAFSSYVRDGDPRSW